MQWVRYREGREQEVGDWIEGDTDAPKRSSTNDRNVEKSLPIENVCKGKNIDECNCTCINDLRAYNIDNLALRKGAAYQYGNRLMDEEERAIIVQMRRRYRVVDG